MFLNIKVNRRAMSTIASNINFPKSFVNVVDWHDWRWQQRNAFKDEESLREALGNWSDKNITGNIKKNLLKQKMLITPYYLQLILDSTRAGSKIETNPLWRQVVPFWQEEPARGYDGETENWELSDEMKTPICQHKYDNRVILRMSNTCNAYCQFCFEALRTLKVKTNKSNVKQDSFNASLEYIANTAGIEEVILSGGDPLSLSDEKLERYLSALRDLNEKLLIRIHSRALSFNPYRVTDQLLSMMEKHGVNSFGVHVCHPDELSGDFKNAIKRIQKVVPIIFSNMPFLQGINDDESILHTLFIELYRLGVKPYYLYHYMPFSPGARVYKASVKKGIAIMSKLKRRVSNIAMPEYVLPHEKGKFTVPLIEAETDFPKFETDQTGKRYYRFVNWKGEQCSWHDN
jgi:lysine 2,3-aminomutase